MKLNYYEETDSLYIDMSDDESFDSLEVSESVVIDYNEAGKITGIDIDHASEVLKLNEMIMNHFPIQQQKRELAA